MKLRDFQKMVAGYLPDTELLVESIDDGSRHSISGLDEDHIHETGGGRRIALCLFPEGRVRRTWEYKTTAKQQIGDEAGAGQATPPEGDGWELVSVSISGGGDFFYWWKR